MFNISSEIKEITEDDFWNHETRLFLNYTEEKLPELEKFPLISDEHLKQFSKRLFACIGPSFDIPGKDYSKFCLYYSFNDNEDLKELFKKVKPGHRIRIFYSDR